MTDTSGISDKFVRGGTEPPELTGAPKKSGISTNTPVSISIRDLAIGGIGLVATLFGVFLFFEARYAQRSTVDGLANQEELLAIESRIIDISQGLEDFENSTDTKIDFIVGEFAKIGDVGTLKERINSVCSTPKIIDQDVKRLLDEMRRFIKNTMYQEVVLKEGVNVFSDDHKIAHILKEISKFEIKISGLPDYCTFSDGRDR